MSMRRQQYRESCNASSASLRAHDDRPWQGKVPRVGAHLAARSAISSTGGCALPARRTVSLSADGTCRDGACPRWHCPILADAFIDHPACPCAHPSVYSACSKSRYVSHLLPITCACKPSCAARADTASRRTPQRPHDAPAQQQTSSTPWLQAPCAAGPAAHGRCALLLVPLSSARTPRRRRAHLAAGEAAHGDDHFGSASTRRSEAGRLRSPCAGPSALEILSSSGAPRQLPRATGRCRQNLCTFRTLRPQGGAPCCCFLRRTKPACGGAAERAASRQQRWQQHADSSSSLLALPGRSPLSAADEWRAPC